MTAPTPTQGPCSPWDPIWCCDLSAAGSAAVSGVALQAATEVLYHLSGQRFDICQFTVRPCRRDCGDSWWGGGFGGVVASGGGGSWWEWGGGGWPRPFNFNGAWFNLTCGGCAGSCSCSPLSEAWLPGPVSSIVSVKLDGQTLPASGYRIDDFRKLVRLGGQFWPICQDMSKADTEVDTWSVTYTVGETVPVLGQWAVGELACEFIKACTGAACVIPRNATNITRQGITIDFPLWSDLLTHGLLGLRWTDMFVSTYNPNRLRAAPMVFDVDQESNRRTTWP